MSGVGTQRIALSVSTLASFPLGSVGLLAEVYFGFGTAVLDAQERRF